MKWRIEQACSLDVTSCNAPKATTVRVRLSAVGLDRVCIGLCLLEQALIDSLDFRGMTGDSRLRIERSSHAASIQLGRHRIDLSLDTVALEMWQYFTLRAVRDGIAEVGHINMEIALAGATPDQVDVVIVYPSSAPPVSPDERSMQSETFRKHPS